MISSAAATEFSEELLLGICTPGKGLDELEASALKNTKSIFNNVGNYSHPERHGNQTRHQLLQQPTQHPVNFLLGKY